MTPVLACGAIPAFFMVVIGIVVYAPSWIAAIVLLGSVVHRVAIHKPTSTRCLMGWIAIVALGVSSQMAILSHLGISTPF